MSDDGAFFRSGNGGRNDRVLKDLHSEIEERPLVLELGYFVLETFEVDNTYYVYLPFDSYPSSSIRKRLPSKRT